MNDRIDAYLQEVFRDLPDTRKTRELKEEMAANLRDRMSDLRASGLSEDEAFARAVDSIGDRSELGAAASVGSDTIPPPTAGPAGPVDSRAVPALGGGVPDPDAVAKKRRKDERDAISGAMWLLLVVGYFLTGFWFGWWAWNWVIFILGAALQILVSGFILPEDSPGSGTSPVSAGGASTPAPDPADRARKRLADTLSGLLWICAVLAYLVSGFLLGWWAWSWVIFLLAAAVQVLVSGFIHD